MLEGTLRYDTSEGSGEPSHRHARRGAGARRGSVMGCKAGSLAVAAATLSPSEAMPTMNSRPSAFSVGTQHKCTSTETRSTRGDASMKASRGKHGMAWCQRIAFETVWRPFSGLSLSTVRAEVCMSQASQQMCQAHPQGATGAGPVSEGPTGGMVDLNGGVLDPDRQRAMPAGGPSVGGPAPLHGHEESIKTPLQPFVDHMKDLGREQKWSEALQVLGGLVKASEEDSSKAPDLITFNAAISAVSKSGRWKEAQKLLKEMEESGIQPDVVSYTSVISARSRSRSDGGTGFAEAILSEMESRGVLPNSITYNAALSGCWRRGDWQGALGLLERMRATGHPGVEPDAMSFNLAIRACGKEGRRETAATLLAEMVEIGLQPTRLTYQYMLASCRAVREGKVDWRGAWKHSLALLEEMREGGITPDHSCFQYAVEAAAKAGEVDSALELIGQMEASGVCGEPLVYNQAIKELKQRGDWQQALAVMDRMRAAGVSPDIYTYAMSMEACGRGGAGRGRSLCLLEELKQEGLWPNTVIYNILLEQCKGLPRGAHIKGRRRARLPKGHGHQTQGGARLEQGAQARGGANGVYARDPEPLPSSLSTAAVGAPGSGGWDQEEAWVTARRLLEEMISSGGVAAPDKMSYELCMQACINAGHPGEAVSVFRQMRRRTRGGTGQGE
ncbi:unnamed protein product, partial [Discosporangium mesarthrocarpum]